MPRKGIAILAVIGLIVLGVLLVRGGGSTDHSSEWNSAQTAELESELAEELAFFTSAGITCYTEGTQAAFGPSESDEANSDSGKEKLESMAKKCAESSENVQGILSEACEEEGLLGSACQDEMINQATQGLGLDNEYEEGYGYPEEDEYEYEDESNEGLNELNEERQQEIEQEEAEGLATPESSSP